VRIPGVVYDGELCIKFHLVYVAGGFAIVPLHYSLCKRLWSRFDPCTQRRLNELILQAGLEPLVETSGGTLVLQDEQLAGAAQGLEFVVPYCG